MTDLSWMLAPVLICLVSVAALGWFGLHVLQRGVIFVDLALAQIAALGATYAVYLGHDADEPITLLLSLLFTMFGALAFASIRQFEDRVPQEAIIGISYAVSAALGVLLIELAADPHGAEKVQHLLVGNIVWVRWSEIATAAVVVAVVGVVHGLFGRRFLQISMDPDGAAAGGMRVAAWDLLFYVTFGAVLTAIVSIIGVLLVFSLLVIPAVVGRLFAHGIGARLAIAYGLATAASVVGVAVSYEHSTGPIIVSLLGLALVVALAVVSVRQATRPSGQVLKLVGATALIGVVLWGFGQASGEHDDHDHAGPGVHGHGHEHAAELAAPAPVAADPLDAEADPLTRLDRAIRLAQAGDAAGLHALADLTRADAPFIRSEAHDRLVLLAGDSAPAYDPFAGPDDGAWAAWAADPPADWTERAASLPPP